MMEITVKIGDYKAKFVQIKGTDKYKYWGDDYNEYTLEDVFETVKTIKELPFL